jgi:hypothetical protein
MKLTDLRSCCRLLGAVAVSLAALQSVPAFADAGGLRAKYTELREQLRNNSYQRAMYVDSAESPNSLRGDVYAVLDHPFNKVSEGLKDPSQWCDVMLLPFNTKYCHAVNDGLVVRIGRKYDQPVEQAFKLQFAYRNLAASNDYYESRLNAGAGPFGTRDYRIDVSAVPLDNGRTFMHLSYSYGYGTLGKMAMQGYLSTAGASKVGFSPNKDPNGQPGLTTGVRGAIERNAMRYYLAIDAYLQALGSPAAQRFEQSLEHWFSDTERFARQLREVERDDYLTMKRGQYQRQQAGL